MGVPEMKVKHIPRPRVTPGKPFAHFQWNYGWGIWEQVVPEAAGKRGVIAAFYHPTHQSPSATQPQGVDGAFEAPLGAPDPSTAPGGTIEPQDPISHD